MSVVIIGGGDGVRNAVSDTEKASLTWTDGQRNYGEKMFQDIQDMLNANLQNPQSLP